MNRTTTRSAVTSASHPARHLAVETPVGRYLIAARRTADGDAVTGVWREAQAHFPRAERLGSHVTGKDPLLEEASQQLLDFLAGTRTVFDVPLRLEGTAFQCSVWEQLRRIPFGDTTTYGSLARQIGSPRAAQAVGAAVGANPISILVPCHRVVAADGSLTGYAGGIGTKEALLRIEGVLGA
ncbi:methylated-DNA--[protein]-cysteine S-methyltransferase [Brachybacterium kimchii]|uniref:Methylated-DNA--protein-cysteine methyltransferase n=1 Tax=Brachybacterium kimchii TaxID=2942909 RepID=A0ABY4N9Z9_9MICO|nr:methylated-DNA--[protein]-cysteine S-methyltransferase [Brachybacterium kimchii]UQN31379.1 methylated-DNA--[protein]-cysteine S-methyltransferase [Brachybacterium kimchii]